MLDTLVLSSFVVEELMAVAKRKFPAKRDVIDRFLSELGYELVYTPHKMKAGLIDIRDINDYPVLYTAIIEDLIFLLQATKISAASRLRNRKFLPPLILCQNTYNFLHVGCFHDMLTPKKM